ncbi:LOW QUALITY PROTEIN: uncharacterized protein LOC126748442 [Anthonomus grandis grandis]|uniref:LOW QUALITY PROTEIN: uncharacterized protein LOC126748442 n=1 Tax=Anthonomus grandis grandis TaxID=2921223 RepID=UPI002165856B|nr:LOW QUALITY PROTEIN: uncharacterized protein LOC126748442 [Anthonomus grandis grandis]
MSGNDVEKAIGYLPDLLRFIDLMVRQVCRRAHYDTYMCVNTDDEHEIRNTIFSTEHLKQIYDKPREHIYYLLKNPQKTLKGIWVEHDDTLQKKVHKYSHIEQKILLDFIKKVQELFPSFHFAWIDLHHYLFYSYRNFVSIVPNTTNNESLSTLFVSEMRGLITCLRMEDESQLWLRIFTLLREYCIFAQWHFSQHDYEEALKKFFAYYEAMLIAAKSLVPVMLEFERDVLYKNYRVSWVDFNSLIFAKYFYESDRVKSRIDEFLRTKRSPGDSMQLYNSMNKLIKMWAEMQAKVASTNQERKFEDNSLESLKNKKVLSAHKKLLLATFWVDRSSEVKNLIDMERIDQNLFDLLMDRRFFPEGPGLNKNGQCICEECLIAKYKVYLDYNEDFSFIATEERTTCCRKCKCILNLEQFQRHVNGHVDDSLAIQRGGTTKSTLNHMDNVDVVKLSDSTVQLTEFFNDKLKISSKAINKVKKNEMNRTKIAFEKFVQSRKQSKLVENVKNGRYSSLRDELVANGYPKPKSNEHDHSVMMSHVTPDKLAETEHIMTALGKLYHKPSEYFSTGCNEPSAKKEFQGFPPEVPRPKDCDCTYCRVFGSKGIIEPKDKLRVRYNRKRDRRKEQETYEMAPPETEIDRFKEESRVPLPPSPLHFYFARPRLPPTPPQPTTPPSIPSTPTRQPSTPPPEIAYTISKINEIRGLVNFIEGKNKKNKAEMAEKKAAKKARQKEKREQERVKAELEVKRQLEEEARQEEMRRLEQIRTQEEAEEERRIQEAIWKKKEKKQRQARKRAEEALKKNTIEETIPAMVTIKKIPGVENGIPQVTITLKGCTPQQNQILTHIVEDPKKVKIQNEKKVSNQQGQSKAIANECKDKGRKGKKNNQDQKSAKSPYQKPADIEKPQNDVKVISKDVKVTLTVDKTMNVMPDVVFDAQIKKSKQKQEKIERELSDFEAKLVKNLKLPPGISITKIETPSANSKKYLGSSANNSNSSVLGKSGVIVVETEKLIKKNDYESNKPAGVPSKTSKKKKKNKKPLNAKPDEAKDQPKMVTLRNPMFQQFQPSNFPSLGDNTNRILVPPDESAPAAIFTSENGMVTIRSSRLQHSIESGMVASSNGFRPLGLPIYPGREENRPSISNYMNPTSYNTENRMTYINEPKEEVDDTNGVSSMDAQEILSGLPGIEITKIDKECDDTFCNGIDNSSDDNHAEVSIIPSNGADMELDFNKNDEDWLYDSVFQPKDVLDEDLDEEELELEAFKRFCQQSIPPKKKKVAHFNVSEIIFKKKQPSDVFISHK